MITLTKEKSLIEGLYGKKFHTFGTQWRTNYNLQKHDIDTLMETR